MTEGNTTLAIILGILTPILTAILYCVIRAKKLQCGVVEFIFRTPPRSRTNSDPNKVVLSLTTPLPMLKDGAKEDKQVHITSA